MELLSIQLREGEEGFQRIVGKVRFDDGFEEEIWFEAPPNLSLNCTGTPWLAALLPLAATINESIHLPFPVDSDFLARAKALLRLWKSWYPWASIVKLDVEVEKTNIREETRQVASFFSGGVDSFFSALRHPEATHWLYCLGFDMPVEHRPAFKQHSNRLSQVAAEMDKVLITGATNLRQTRWRKAPWELLSHGPALGMVALFHEQSFSKVFVPSSKEIPFSLPWGSHPLSDPLFSSSSMEVVHDGVEYTRLQKTEFICNFDVALRHLHVCYRGQDGTGQDDTNCCSCRKCFRTMTTLAVYGKLQKAALFCTDDFTMERLTSVYLDKVEKTYFLAIQQVANEKGCYDISNAIEKSLTRSLKSRKHLKLAEYIGKFPLIWRLEQRLRQFALRGLISR